MSKFVYGLDFGTTNSALAILDLDSNEIVKVFSVPSLLFFPEEQKNRNVLTYYVGEQAIEGYVASRMKGRFMKSIKKVLPNKSFTKTKIFSKYYKAEELVSFIMSHLKKLADDFLGETITTAVIGRPVVFDEDPEKDAFAQQRLSKAAELAGFKTYYFQMEPIAAAYTYERKITSEELVLVADFGGGTSDFTLMKLNPKSVANFDRKKDMISKGGIYLGGDNFDADMMWDVGTPHFGRGVKEEIDGQWLDLPTSYFFNICSWQKMSFLNTLKMSSAIKRSYRFSKNNHRVKNLMTLIEKNLGYLLFKEIEKSKIELTKQEESTFAFDQFDINFEEVVSIEKFSTIIEKKVNKIDQYLQQYLAKNQITPAEIDNVFMTGGTSQVRPLKDIFTSKFPVEKIKSGDNFNSVVMGLAYSYTTLR